MIHIVHVNRIPNVGGPFLETTIEPDFEGASRQVMLSRCPDYMDDPGAVVVSSTATSMVTIGLGVLFAVGMIVPSAVWL